MIDPRHPVIIALVERGYRISAHAYLTNGLLRYTFAAKHSDGDILQGWSRGGSPDAALKDLAVRAGLGKSRHNQLD